MNNSYSIVLVRVTFHFCDVIKQSAKFQSNKIMDLETTLGDTVTQTLICNKNICRPEDSPTVSHVYK